MLIAKGRFMMRKIWLVFKQDLKNIFTNEITFITVVILLIMPAFFAALIIKANWTPINNSKEVKIALVNQDKGGSINNEMINLGNVVVENVKEDVHLTWEILPYDKAFRGFLIGELYGMLVIPEGFTEEIATVSTAEPMLPKITYMVNARESVFTPTFTETSTSGLQIYIARSITLAVNNAVRNTLEELEIDFTIDNTEIKNTVEALLELDANKELYVEKLKEYRDLAGNIMVLLTNLRDELPDLNQNITRIENIADKAERFLNLTNELETEYASIPGRNMETQIQRSEVLIKELRELAAYIKEEIPQIEGMLQGSNELVTQVYGTFSKVDSTLANITKNIHGLEYKLGFLAHDNDINKLVYMLENEPDLVRESIISPVLIESKKLDGLPNYGSSLAPFNITVAMWMGTNALITMFSTRVQLDLPEAEALNSIEEYLEKGLFFILLACIQDLTIMISCKRILNIYIENYGIFLALGIIGSITFTSLIYTLVSVFGNVGKVATYMLSVLQLFFLGGVYPTQIVPPVFRSINKVLPFIYVIGNFREAQLGIITDNLLKSGGILFTFIIGAIIVGIIGRTVLAPYIEKARELVRASHLGKQDY